MLETLVIVALLFWASRKVHQRDESLEAHWDARDRDRKLWERKRTAALRELARKGL